MKTSKEVFSENLRTKLEEKRKSQKQLAKALNVTEAAVSRWVNAEAMPRSNMIDKMAQFFMCSVDDLTASKQRTFTLLPEDVIAEELHNNAKLFKLFLVASKATDEQIDACIALLKK